MAKPVKVLSVSADKITFEGEFWDAEKQRYYTLKTTCERKFLYNYMSREYASRHGLSKYYNGVN